MLKINNILAKIVKYGLYAVILTPLAFWPRVIYPFLTSKFILFQILVEIIFGAWLILAIADKKYRPEFSRLTLAMTVFLIVSFISAFFGADFQRSLWGIGPRMTGLFAELHFFLWFLALAGYLKNDRNKWNSYLNFSFFIAIAVAATAFYTNAKWGLVFGYGIFNNPTFLAPYLIFHFFWGLYQTINKRQTANNRNWQRWFFGAGTAFLLAMILRAQLRGAILGLLLGLFVFGIGLIFSKVLSRSARLAVAGFYIFILIALIGLWLLRENSTLQNLSPIKRITGFSLQETTVQTRLLVWKAAWEGFRSKSVFGFGPENFNYLFNANYNPHSLKFGGGGFNETWFDKPHNAFLEVLSETGLAGSLAYIFIWITLVMVLFRLYKAGDKILSITLAGAFIAYLGAIFLAFDSFGSWFGVYLFLAFLISNENSEFRILNFESNSNDSILKHSVIQNSFKIENLKFKILISPVIFASVFALLYVNYSVWRAGLADANAIRLFPSDPTQGMVLFKQSLSYWTPYRAEYQLDLFTAVAGALQKKSPIPNFEENINFVIEEGDKMIAAKSNDAFYYASMTKLYNILGELGRDPQIIAWAETYGKKALELSPKRQEILFYLSRTALLKGDAKSAVYWTHQAVDVDPTIPMSHWFLGVAYLADKQEASGKEEIKKALDLGYSLQNQKEKYLMKSLGL